MLRHPHRALLVPLIAPLRISLGVGLAIAALALPAGCETAQTITDPVATLNQPGLPGRDYLAAMAVGDRNPDDPNYRTVLRRVVVNPGYVIEGRRAAYARLREIDPQGLAETLTINLPKMDAVEWRRELCERIAKEQWREMTPTLVRAWAASVPAWAKLGKERPERLAIAAMYGEDKVVDALLETFAAANPLTQTNLRSRCWQLLLLEGQEARLRELLADESRASRDPMLRDIRAGVVDLGVLPRTREEILWIQALRGEANRGFWTEATAAVAKLSPERRATLELRDIPVAVNAARFAPELLTASDRELESMIVNASGGSDRRVHSPDFEGYGNDFSERLAAHRAKLLWGDYAAMVLALEAVSVPQVLAHLFEVGDRDLADRASELGGMLSSDAQGRYEFVEYPSRTRGNDARYEAPQALMDALYTGLFHVHFHAQAYDGRRYAGPHMGDFEFADSTRLNGLVLTFLDSNRLNLDFYRYGKVVVDLGVIERPSR
jgi:hypothetical protein